MTSFFHDFVANRLSRLRMCVLYLLGMAALCLALGLGRPPMAATVSANDANALPKDALSGMVVALDPGHGGYDGGARARDSGLWEKEITLSVALAVEKELADHGAKVMLTRREDMALCGEAAALARKRKDLEARVDMAREAGATVLLSIHMNEYRSRRESGPQVFYQRGGDDGRLLSGVLQKALIDELKPKKERVAMAGDYFVLRSSIPSALVECGFISNPEEEKLLLSPEYQQRIGKALAQGLAEYGRLTKQREGATITPSAPPPAAP